MRSRWIRRRKYGQTAESIQTDPDNPGLKEEYAYPAQPDSEYGWKKRIIGLIGKLMPGNNKRTPLL